MSWDQELWVAVSLIQSATHGAVQYTASVLIVRYAFAAMHNLFLQPFSLYLGQQGERIGENHTLVNPFTHTKCFCVARKQVCTLHPSTTTQFLFSSLWHSQTNLHLNSPTVGCELYILFNNILSCHWVDLSWPYCAVCCLFTFKDAVGRKLGRSCEHSLVSCIYNYVKIAFVICSRILIGQWNLICLTHFFAFPTLTLFFLCKKVLMGPI